MKQIEGDIGCVELLIPAQKWTYGNALFTNILRHTINKYKRPKKMGQTEMIRQRQ
jgi:hypothetical protein